MRPGVGLLFCFVAGGGHPASSSIKSTAPTPCSVLAQEVFSQDKPRMSIQGWFHTDQVRPPTRCRLLHCLGSRNGGRLTEQLGFDRPVGFRLTWLLTCHQ